MSSSGPVQQLTPFGAALAGALGGCFSNAVVYPLDVAKTRIQASHADPRSPNRLAVLPLLVRILKEEGIAGYFKGFSATMHYTTPEYAYFFFYSFVRGAYIRRLTARLPKGSKAPVLSTAMELILGAVAGGLAQIFTIPVSVIATRQQIGHSLDRKRKGRSPRNTLSYAEAASSPTTNKSPLSPTPSSPERVEAEEYTDDSFFGVAREIIEEEGVGGLWLGIKPGLVLTVNPAITYGVYERLKNVILASAQAGAKLSPGQSFLVGALSKTLATVVTYPYIMAKVRIQARSADAIDAREEHGSPPHAHKPHHDKGRHAHSGAIDILKRVWKQEGFRGWYQGMGAQILKAVLSQGVLFMSKDQFETWALVIMAFAYRLARK